MKYINKWLWSVVQVHVPVQTENTKARVNIFTAGWLKKHSKYKHILAEFLIWGSLPGGARRAVCNTTAGRPRCRSSHRMSSSGSHHDEFLRLTSTLHWPRLIKWKQWTSQVSLDYLRVAGVVQRLQQITQRFQSISNGWQHTRVCGGVLRRDTLTLIRNSNRCQCQYSSLCLKMKNWVIIYSAPCWWKVGRSFFLHKTFLERFAKQLKKMGTNSFEKTSLLSRNLHYGGVCLTLLA